MEATAKQELESRLGSPKRPIPADSTAGVSLSGLTSSDSARVKGKTPVGSWVGSLRPETVAGAGMTVADEVRVESEQAPSPIEVVHLTADSEQVCFDFDSTPPITDMAILFTRAEDTTRQDIVRMSDILDLCTNDLSWSELVKILNVDDGLGVGFTPGRDFFIVNSQIRVRNERQFFACLQYLYNFGIMSSDAYVYRC